MHAQEVKQLVYLSVIVVRMKMSQSGDRGKHNKSIEIIKKIMYLARPTSIANAVFIGLTYRLYPLQACAICSCTQPSTCL